MFQFPGFALKTLCIQVISTCLSSLKIAEAIYNELSSGFPHSEILGSKPILGSPKLIAEYHVLHRLLLPRHPPNALLALDLIQKKIGSVQSENRWVNHPLLKAAPTLKRSRGSKAYYPAPSAGSSEGTCAARVKDGLVSVLDLEFHAFGVEPQAVQHLGRAKHETGVSLSRSNRRSKRTARISKTLMCNLSKRCQFIQDWMAEPTGSTIKS